MLLHSVLDLSSNLHLVVEEALKEHLTVAITSL